MKSIFAYTDESGNTGSNLFDLKQPIFTTCTLLSSHNLDIALERRITQILTDLNISELHANELGLDNIEKYANVFIELLDKYSITPIITITEKLHVAKLKLFDTVFDSGINKNVSNFHYGPRYLRLPLALFIVANTSEEMAKTFWEIYEKHDSDLFKSLLNQLKSKLTENVKDARALEVLNHGLVFAINNPDEILNHQRDTYDAPNMVAFGLLLNGLHDYSKYKKGKINQFIHDEQDEFSKTMEKVFAAMKSASTPQSMFSYIGQIEKVETFLNPMAIKSSHNSFGLQLVDICLWIYNRKNPKIFEQYPNIQKLKSKIEKIAYIYNFTRDQLEDNVIQIKMDTATHPLSEQEIKKGKTFLKKINGQINIG